MEHQFIVLVHLLCAVLFAGAIALEVLVLEPVRKIIGEALFRRVEFYMFRRIRRVYPFAVIPLYATGFYLYFDYVERFGGFSALVATHFGQLLTLKMGLALGLLAIFASAPFLFMGRQPRPLLHFLVVTGGPGDFRIDRFEAVHYAAMGLAFGIIVLAKLMFIL
jgi:hypothetical protein